MKDAAVLTVAFDLGSSITAWSLRKHVSFSFLLVVGLPWTIFDLVGTKVLIGNNQAGWLKPCFGILLFVVLLTDAFATWRNARQAKAPEPPRDFAVDSATPDVPSDLQGDPVNTLGHASRNDSAPASPCKSSGKASESTLPFNSFENWRRCLFLGVAGGLLKGLFTVPMPVLVLFVLFSGIDRDTWRANIIVMSIVGVIPKGYYLFFVEQEMEWAKVPQFVATIVGVMAANPIGNFVASRVDKEQFKDIVRLFAFVGGCFMVAAGESFQLELSFASLVLGLIVMCRRWRRRANVADQARGEGVSLRSRRVSEGKVTYFGAGQDEEDDLSPRAAAAERLAERELRELGAAVDAKV